MWVTIVVSQLLFVREAQMVSVDCEGCAFFVVSALASTWTLTLQSRNITARKEQGTFDDDLIS